MSPKPPDPARFVEFASSLSRLVTDLDGKFEDLSTESRTASLFGIVIARWAIEGHSVDEMIAIVRLASPSLAAQAFGGGTPPEVVTALRSTMRVVPGGLKSTK